MYSLQPIRFAVLALGVFLSFESSGGDVVAVVSARNSVQTLTVGQVADIYLGRSSRFPDGTPAVPCDLSEGSPLRDLFYSRVTGKSPAQVKAHWSKLMFTGRGQPPREVPSSADAKKFVSDHPNAICYIDNDLVDRSVTVVLTP